MDFSAGLYLNKIREKIDFLKLIPEDLFRRLNFHEFYMPDREVNLARKTLEEQLNCFIMCYQINPFSNPHAKNLCELIYTAALTDDQVNKLTAYEIKFNNVIFVAYAKPLKFCRNAL